jgi:hypothetical protein
MARNLTACGTLKRIRKHYISQAAPEKDSLNYHNATVFSVGVQCINSEASLPNRRRVFAILNHGGGAMKKAAIVLMLILFADIQVTSTFAAERRTALVIGNANYDKSRLRNPVNDANDIAKALGELGFNVTLKTDASQKVMEQSIKDMGRQLISGGVGLFYYAGHAIQYQGRNYLIPLHTDIDTEADVKYEAVDAGRVLTQMEQAGNSLNIIILDSCRNNPFARSFRSAEQGLAKMDTPAGSILAYATAPGSVAADGTGRNGLYTSMLLKHMATPDMDLQELFMQVRKEVRLASNNMQTPWESTSLTRHFYFNPIRGVALAPDPQPVAGPSPKDEPENTAAPKNTTTANVDPKAVNPEAIVDRYGKFVKYTNGVVYDTETNLEWFAGPAEKNTTWFFTKRWVMSLNVDGGGWRMPMKDELMALFRKPGTNRGFDVPSLLEFKGKGYNPRHKQIWYEPEDSTKTCYMGVGEVMIYGGGYDLTCFNRNETGKAWGLALAVRSRN